MLLDNFAQNPAGLPLLAVVLEKAAVMAMSPYADPKQLSLLRVIALQILQNEAADFTAVNDTGSGVLQLAKIAGFDDVVARINFLT